MKAYLSIILLILAACGTQTEPLAKLTFVSGDVLVNGAFAGLEHALAQGDIVETLAGSQATITFYNSSIVRLSEATTLELSELTESRTVKLKQTAGETWTRVLKITGIGEYKIETPNAVATVRGTGFKVLVEESKTEVAVGEGTVHVAKVADGEIIAETSVEADQKATIEQAHAEAMAQEQILIEEIEFDEFLSENLDEDELLINDLISKFNLEQLFGELEDIELDARKLLSKKLTLEIEEQRSDFEETLTYAEESAQLIEDEPAESAEKTETDETAPARKKKTRAEDSTRADEEIQDTPKTDPEQAEPITTDSEDSLYRTDEKQETGISIIK